MGTLTINDLAKITGFSKSTVSCALNNKKGVGEEARKEIMRIAKEYGYTPNYFAKKISSKDYRTVGVILRDLTNPFYANVFCAIDRLAEGNNYETIFYNLGGDINRVKIAIDLMREKMVSGIILDFFGYEKEIIKQLEGLSIPSVIFGLNVDADISSVQADDKTGAAEAVDYGVKCGYTKIYYIGKKGGDVFDRLRAETIKVRIKSHNLNYKNCIIYSDEENIAESILNHCPKNSLLICYNDILACSVIRRLMERKYYVPEDYSVIGFDNISIVPYSLTTVEIPQYRMAEEAFHLLQNQMEGKGEKKKVLLETKLIVRGSVKTLDKQKY